MDVSIYDQSFKTATDLSAKQGYFVKMSADLTVALAGNGEKAVGVLMNDPTYVSATESQTATVRCFGRASVYVGTSVAVTDKVASDASGKCVPAATGDHVIGIALTAGDATAAQPMCEILICPGGAPLP
jgi:hypothetical protein